MNHLNNEAQVAKKLEVSKKNLRLYQDKVIDRLCTINLYGYIKDHKSNNHNNLLWHINNRRYREVNDTNDEDRSKIFIKYYLLYNLLYKMVKPKELEGRAPIYLFFLQQLQFIYDIDGTFDIMLDKKEFKTDMPKRCAIQEYFFTNLRDILLEYPTNTKFNTLTNLSKVIEEFMEWYVNISVIKTMEDLKESVTQMYGIIDKYLMYLRKYDDDLKCKLEGLNDKGFLTFYGDEKSSDMVGVLVSKTRLRTSPYNFIPEATYEKKHELRGILEFLYEGNSCKRIPVTIKFDKIIPRLCPEICPSYRTKFQFPIEELKDLKGDNYKIRLFITTGYEYDISTGDRKTTNTLFIEFDMDTYLQYIR